MATSTLRLCSCCGSGPARREGVRSETYSYTVRGREITGNNYRESLSHQKIPKIAAPDFSDWGEQLRFLQKENLPGAYPYTGGVYPYRRLGEDPTRMFAGEGTPERTNRRFHYLSLGQTGRAAVDCVRFGHAVWRGSARASWISTERLATQASQSQPSMT